jgi:D-serine deaminase-like pyridoxal phosphate-dependent protein
LIRINIRTPNDPMCTDFYRVTNEEEIPSPALLLYRERIDHNIRAMISVAGAPERLRPHVKTHKLEQVVKAQTAAGITKFKCATIAEAEMTAGAGACEVMLAHQPVGPNIGRLLELQRRFPTTKFATITDAESVIQRLSAACTSAGTTLEVFLDLDCGMHRTGVVPGPEAARLYRMIAEAPGLVAGGLHAYDGHIRESDPEQQIAECEAAMAPVLSLREALLRDDLPVPHLVVGGSPSFAAHARHSDRELSPGTVILWDFGYGDLFPHLPFVPAALVLTRVISKPGPNRLCLDLGHKAIAAENPHPRVRLLELPSATTVSQSEEHLVIETPEADRFNIGDCLYGIPRHVCPTVALHAEAWIVEDGKAVARWPILARARRITV